MPAVKTKRKIRRIVIAANRADADSTCRQKSVEPDGVEWFTNVDKITPGNLGGAWIFFAPAMTHRTDYAEAYAKAKSLTGN